MPQSASMNASKPSAWDQRTAIRYPTKLHAFLSSGTTASPVVIVDLSATGALVTGKADVRIGSTVRLTANAVDVTATVVRQTATGLGLRFHRDVEPLEIVRQNHPELAHLRSRRRAAAAARGDTP